MEFRLPDGSCHKPKSKEILSDIPKGTIMRQVAGGGGGYGEAYIRPAEKVVKEVKNGTLSLKRAKEDYDIIVNPETFEMNRPETERLRGRKSVK
jgi:N-methylhydantoinase B